MAGKLGPYDIRPPASTNSRLPATEGAWSCSATSMIRRRIMEVAEQDHAPSVAGSREFVDAGGLMSYGPSFPAMFRQAAMYVSKILKGAKPADLPVEQPTKFELEIG